MTLRRQLTYDTEWSLHEDRRLYIYVGIEEYDEAVEEDFRRTGSRRATAAAVSLGIDPKYVKPLEVWDRSRHWADDRTISVTYRTPQLPNAPLP